MLCSSVAGRFSLLAKTIVLFLSCNIVVVGMYWPYTVRKCLVHRTRAIELSIATSSASVKLLVFSFCIPDVEYISPFPKVINILL